MTDPNMPPPEPVMPPPEPMHEPPRQTTINVNPERSGGGSGVIGFLVGGLLVVVAIIAAVLYMKGDGAAPGETNLDVNIDIPAPRLPDAPRLPEAPTLPPVEPTATPSPTAGN